MASTTSVPAEQAQTRPSFAKVAASAYKPPVTNEVAPSVKPPIAAATAQPAIHSQNSQRPIPANGDAPIVHVEKKNEESHTREKAGNTAIRAGQWATTTQQQPVLPAEPKEEEAEKPPPSIALVRFSGGEDGTTQLSSSDGSAKPPSLDGKSVASGVTLGLDEKESIRPDDSASLRAVEEEDVISPPESVAADSRVGSDNGAARAFRDQLREIQSQRGIPPGRYPNPLPTLYDPNQRPISEPTPEGVPEPAVGPQSMPAIPDEKLIEALQSPRDRLFVVKIEQDFIDFIKDSREMEYCLPNCNTFYRMLAHRLADYYLLGHVVDSTMTGVRITRTPYCRIPPSLSQMVDASKSANTPPVDLPARKIMRRGGEGKSGTNTTANSENPSKSTSEIGGSDGDDKNGTGGNSKDKSALTREEREARYREARQRIFGSAESEENESNEANGSGEEKDISRSSSASGKKKNKKQRNYDDDGFEARSRFNAYYPGQYPAPGFNGDSTVYYSGYPAPMLGPQYPPMSQAASPPPSYNTGYPVMMPQEAPPQFGWAGQQYQPPNGGMVYPSYGQMQNGYDLSADFQRGMQSFQSANVPSQMTPKMAHAPMATYQDAYPPPPQQMPMNAGWPQMNQQSSYPMLQGSYAPNGPGNRPMSAPIQGPVPGTYPYGQFPPPMYNGKPNRNQHPIPGSYNRQQFNPQSQAFVPGGRNMPFQMQQNVPGMPPQGMNGYANFQMPGSVQMPPQMARPSPPTAHPSSFGSPRGMQNANLSLTPHLTSSQPTPSPQSSSQYSSSSVPAQSSIAKYGTPSHLPPKPPAPQPPPQAPKFNLPAHNFPSMTRVPSNPPPGFVTNAPQMVSMRGGTGPNGNST